MNRKWFLTSAFALLTATGIFWGCQKEEVINPDNDLFLKSTVIYTEGDCDTKCLDLEATELTAYEKTYSKDYTTTPPENVTVKIYNNATQIVYTITSTTRIKYLQIGNVVYHNTPQNDNSTANNPLILGPIGISLPTPWSSCEPLENTIIVRRNQQNPTGNTEKELVFNTSYSLIGICTSTTVEADFEEPVCIDETEVTITGTVESGGSFTGGFIRLQELINNEWVDINGAEADVTATNKVVIWSYIPDIAGSREFRAVYDGSGSNGYNNSESVPVVVQAENCNVCDDANFSYQTEDNLDIVFSYNHDEEAELSIEFTFPQVLNLPLTQD